MLRYVLRSVSRALECETVLDWRVVLSKAADGFYAGDIRVHEALVKGSSVQFPLLGRIVEDVEGVALVPGDSYVILIPFHVVEKLLGGLDGVEVEGAVKVVAIPRCGLLAQVAGKGAVVRRRSREYAFMCDGTAYVRAQLTCIEKELLSGEVFESDFRNTLKWLAVDVVGDVDDFYFSVRGVYISRRLVRRDEAGYFMPLPARARLVKFRTPLLVPDEDHCVDVAPGPWFGEPIVKLENGVLTQYRC